MKTPTIVLGVIGSDCHCVGNKILDAFFSDHGYRVVNLGVMVSQDEFIDAAIESAAAAILVSSLYGHAEIDCAGFRERCVERGLDDILLYIGGNLVVGKMPREAIERQVQIGWVSIASSCPATTWRQAAACLQADISERRGAGGGGVHDAGGEHRHRFDVDQRAPFDLDPQAPHIVRRGVGAHDQWNLAEGFARLLARLLDLPGDVPLECASRPTCRCYFSSSAKGRPGDRRRRHRARPDAARRTTGRRLGRARIVACYAYQLGPPSRSPNWSGMRPDIILLVRRHGRRQRALQPAQRPSAGRLAPRFRHPLRRQCRCWPTGSARSWRGKQLLVTDNLMPEVGQLRIEPARQRIQEIFLQHDRRGQRPGAKSPPRCAAEPRPTPLAVFDLLAAMADASADWNDLLVIDLGGATTDVYSVHRSFWGEPGFVLKGLCEPRLKRTVEGRPRHAGRAPAVLETADDYVERELAARGIPLAADGGVCGRRAAVPGPSAERRRGAALRRSAGRRLRLSRPAASRRPRRGELRRGRQDLCCSAAKTCAACGHGLARRLSGRSCDPAAFYAARTRRRAARYGRHEPAPATCKLSTPTPATSCRCSATWPRIIPPPRCNSPLDELQRVHAPETVTP